MRLDLLAHGNHLLYFTITGFRQILTDKGNTDQRDRELISYGYI